MSIADASGSVKSATITTIGVILPNAIMLTGKIHSAAATDTAKRLMIKYKNLLIIRILTFLTLTFSVIKRSILSDHRIIPIVALNDIISPRSPTAQGFVIVIAKAAKPSELSGSLLRSTTLPI